MGVLDDLTSNQRTQQRFGLGNGGQYNGDTYYPYAGILNPGGGLSGSLWANANAVNRPGYVPPVKTAGGGGSNPLLPRPRPWSAPSSMDVAAMNNNPAVGAINSIVPGYQNPALGYAGNGPAPLAMPPANQPGGSLGQLMAGLGAIFGMIPPPSQGSSGGTAQPGVGVGGSGQSGGSSTPRTSFQGSSTGRTYNVGQTYAGTNGYSYVAQPDGTFKQTGRTDPAADRARGQAIGEANRRSPGNTYNVSGDNNAFSPQSVQNSERWQTGY